MTSRKKHFYQLHTYISRYVLGLEEMRTWAALLLDVKVVPWMHYQNKPVQELHLLFSKHTGPPLTEQKERLKQIMSSSRPLSCSWAQ